MRTDGVAAMSESRASIGWRVTLTGSVARPPGLHSPLPAPPWPDSGPCSRSPSPPGGTTMTDSADRPTILIEMDGHTVATAEVHGTDVLGLVHTDMHVESGPLPVGARSRLVDAVLAHPDVDHADRLLATMPLG